MTIIVSLPNTFVPPLHTNREGAINSDGKQAALVPAR